MENEELTREEQILLVEYQMAQQSAEHHDNHIWPAVSFVWGGSLVLFGFVMSNLLVNDLRIPLTVACCLGIIAIILTMWMLHFYKLIIRVKYERCKQIEEVVRMQHHKSLSHPGVYAPGTMKRVLYGFAVVNILAWLVLLSRIWHCNCN